LLEEHAKSAFLKKGIRVNAPLSIRVALLKGGGFPDIAWRLYYDALE
jgi:hypothetical protein